MRKKDIFLIIFVLFFVLNGVNFISAWLPTSSDSPQDEWWTHGKDTGYSRFTTANAPANISNTVNRTFTLAQDVDSGPIVVGDSVFVIPDSTWSDKAYELNASNISQVLSNSTNSYTIAYRASPSYYRGYLFFHTDSPPYLYQINATNLSQIIKSYDITSSDGGYYADPIVFNKAVYVGDGNYNPYIRHLNASNISQVISSYTSPSRVYETSPILNGYVYGAPSHALLLLNASNLAQTLSSASCNANSIEGFFPVSSSYVYKGCTISSVNTVVQFNATNLSQQIASFPKSGWGYALGNGFLYFGSGSTLYQLNASNVSQQIANITFAASISTVPAINPGNVFVAAGNVMYQLNSSNVSNILGSFTAGSTINGDTVIAKGFLYFGSVDNKLYQLGIYNPLPAIRIDYPADERAYLNLTWANYTLIQNSTHTWSDCWYSSDYGTTNSTSVSAGIDFTNLSSVEGWNNLTIYCNDSSSIIYNSSVNYYIDVDYPVFINVTNQNTTDASGLSYTIRATDNSGISCFAVNDTINFKISCSGLLQNNTLLSVGVHNLNISANDTVQHQNSTLISINVTDGTPPVVNITYPVNNTNYSISVSALNYTVSDNIAVSACWWSNSSGAWNSTSVGAGTNWTELTSLQGWNNWTVYCNDTSRNIGRANVKFIVDTTSPNVTLASPVDNYTTNYFGIMNVSFNCSAADNLALRNISLFITNSSNGNFALNRTTNVIGVLNATNWIVGLANGNYTWNCLVFDAVGNSNWSNANRTITINPDITPPSFNNLINQTVYQTRAFGYQINATDNFGISCFTINNTTNFAVNCSGWLKNNTALAVGLYNLNITVNDTSNNINSSLMLVNVTLIPRIGLTLISPTGNINATQNMTFTVSVNVSCSNTNCGEINVSLDPNSIIYNFTTCGTNGASGPNQTQCNSKYTGTSLAGLVGVTNGIQNFTVPATGIYTIEVAGAKGSNTSVALGGNGSKMIGDFYLTAGTVLQILVGQIGPYHSYGGGGGGGSFVANGSSYLTATPMIVAGGGGGASSDSSANSQGVAAVTTINATDGKGSSGNKGTNGNGGGAGTSSYRGAGGGGFYGNGTTGYYSNTFGRAFIYGGAGGPSGSSGASGGFGGGGANGWWGSGGGGGYSGGGGGATDNYGGGGGGSYNSGLNQNNTNGTNSRDGYVTLTYSGGKSGLVSTNTSATPFYTTTTNPYNLTLNNGQSQIITWTVNATGAIWENYTFFVYANKTTDLSIGNITNTWNVTIVNFTIGILPPSISISYPQNINYNTNVSELNYSVSGENLSVCWYSTDNGTTNSSNVVYGDDFINLISREGSNTWSVYCNGTNNTLGSSSVTFHKDTIYPTWTENKTNLTSLTLNNASVYFNITLNDTNPDKYIFSWYNGTVWVNNSAVNYTNGREISVTKVINIDVGIINWTWYFNDTFGNANQSIIFGANLVQDNTEGLAITCEAGGPYQSGALVLVQGNVTNSTTPISNNNVSLIIINTSASVANSTVPTSSLGTYQTSFSGLPVGQYSLNASTSKNGNTLTCQDTFQLGGSASLVLDKIINLYNQTNSSLIYNITLKAINNGLSDVLSGILVDSDSNESPYTLGDISINSSLIRSYLKEYSLNSTAYNISLSIASVNGTNSYSGNEIFANSSQITLVIPSSSTEQQLTLTKNAYYNSENSTHVNYTLAIDVVNSGGIDLTDISLIDSDLSINTNINLNRTQNYNFSSSIIIDKAASNTNKLFVKATATANSVTYSSNQINVRIPGYGGPADAIVNAPASISTSTSFNTAITVENQNPDIGQDFIINYWITNEAETSNYTSGQQTIYVSASGTSNLTATLTSPSTAGNYRFRALVSWAGGTATAYDSFIVASTIETPATQTPSLGGGGSITGNVIDTIVCNTPYIRYGKECCLDKNNNSICDSDDVTEKIQGISVTVEKEKRIKFSIIWEDSVKNHSLEVIDLKEDRVTIKIYSDLILNGNLSITANAVNSENEGIILTLYIGEEKKIDLDWDGNYDLMVRLEEIKDNQTHFYLEPVKGKIEIEKPKILEEEKPEKINIPSYSKIWIILLGIILILMIIIVAKKVKILSLISLKRSTKFYSAVGGWLASKIQRISYNLKIKNRDPTRLNNIIGMEVLSSEGNLIGRVKESYIEDKNPKVYGWLIEVNKNIAKKIGKKLILVKHNAVRSIKQIMIIDKKVLEYLDNLIQEK